MIILLATLLLSGVVFSVAADQDAELWDRAVEAVQFRDYSDAMPLLEVLLERDPTNLRALRLLASVYEMSGRPEDAADLLRSTMNDNRLSNQNRGRAAFDLALLLGRQAQPREAVDVYTASLEHDASLVPVYLNRANLLVELAEYRNAVRDYERFLALRPSTSQRDSIEAMIALLTETIQEEEARRAEEERRQREAEEARRVAEEARREREARERQEAEERRRKMMESVMESLGTARDDARGSRADREGIMDFDDDLDLLD